MARMNSLLKGGELNTVETNIRICRLDLLLEGLLLPGIFLERDITCDLRCSADRLLHVRRPSIPIFRAGPDENHGKDVVRHRNEFLNLVKLVAPDGLEGIFLAVNNALAQAHIQCPDVHWSGISSQ